MKAYRSERTAHQQIVHVDVPTSIEDMFALGGIAYANLPDLTRFDKTVYTAYNQPAETPAP